MPRPADSETVVVGVDGSPEGTEALRYAAGAARARGSRLLVVHAYELPPHRGTMTAAVTAAAWVAASQVTADALSAVRVPPGVDVETLVELTTPVLLLRGLSQRVALIVLGQHTADPSDSVLVGPVSASVAAVSSCPVVIVPTTSYAAASSSWPVVVGLDDRSGAATVLCYAFAEAERRRSPLVALHALPPGSDARQGSVAAERLDTVLTHPRRDHPGVAASTLVVEGDLAQVVLEASASARLLVVGRPVRHRRPGWWQYSATEEIMARLRCPLAVVPQDGADPTGKPYDS